MLLNVCGTLKRIEHEHWRWFSDKTGDTSFSKPGLRVDQWRLYKNLLEIHAVKKHNICNMLLYICSPGKGLACVGES